MTNQQRARLIINTLAPLLLRRARTAMACAAALCANLAHAAEEGTFLALCYHDVRPAAVGHITPDTLTVKTTELVAQLDWLHGQGYQAVRIADIIDAKTGKKPLPPKAVLLTFDDGYDGFYRDVFPLLKLYQMPAVLGLVTSWMEKGVDGSIDYTATPLPRRALLQWDQVRTMVKSGWVEIASHSHNLHRGIIGNPQGNLQPAAETRAYLDTEHRYETDDEYHSRLERDLTQSVAIIERETGIKPRAMIWPFGSFSAESVRIAQDLGMVVTMGLTEGRNQVTDISRLKRLLVRDGANLADIANDMVRPEQRDPKRAVVVRLDDIFDPDNTVQERKLDQVVERINRLKINMTIVLPLSDPLYTGAYNAAYFPNDQLPMRADLFNRVAWQLRTRARTKIYAWTPVYGLRPGGDSDTPKVDAHKLYDAMAKQVHIFGAVVDLGPLEPNVLPPLSGAETQALFAQMKRHRPELITAVMAESSVTDQLLTGTLPLGVRDTFAAAELAVLSAPTLWHDESTLDKLAAQLATLPLGRSHSLIVLPPRRNSAAVSATPELTIASARRLMARGVKNFALADSALFHDDAALNAAKTGFSLANTP